MGKRSTPIGTVGTCAASSELDAHQYLIYHENLHTSQYPDDISSSQHVLSVEHYNL